MERSAPLQLASIAMASCQGWPARKLCRADKYVHTLNAPYQSDDKTVGLRTAAQTRPVC
jgi:hypothetical protein